MSNLLKFIQGLIKDRLEDPLCTIDFDRCQGITEVEIDELKAWCDAQGYTYSDGRRSGWNRFWVKKKPTQSNS